MIVTKKKAIEIVLPIGYVILLISTLWNQHLDISFNNIVAGTIQLSTPINVILLILIKLVPLRFYKFIQWVLGALFIIFNLFWAHFHLSILGLASGNRNPNPFAYNLSIYTVFFAYYLFHNPKKRNLYTYLTLPILFTTTLLLLYLSM